MNLTTKQEKFCQEYLKTGNATKAYKKAYDSKKMKPETITEAASKLLKNYDVATRLNELRNKIEKKNILSAQQLQEELSSYIRDEKEEECIVTISTGLGQTKAIKMTKKVQPKDKLKAIELLCKLAGYNLEKGEINAPIAISFNRNYN